MRQFLPFMHDKNPGAFFVSSSPVLPHKFQMNRIMRAIKIIFIKENKLIKQLNIFRINPAGCPLPKDDFKDPQLPLENPSSVGFSGKASHP